MAFMKNICTPLGNKGPRSRQKRTRVKTYMGLGQQSPSSHIDPMVPSYGPLIRTRYKSVVSHPFTEGRADTNATGRKKTVGCMDRSGSCLYGL